MSTAVVIAFAGALVAAVGTGMLFGRLIRAPRSDLAAWSSVLLLLGVALGAETMGFAVGFGGATFRAAAVCGVLLAPLWAAWGLVELGARSLPARFSMRLATAALTIVPGVILILDPLNTSPSFGKGWPGMAHYMTLPKTALDLIHVFAVAVALFVMGLVVARTRRDPAWWDVFVPVAVACAAVLITVSLGLTLPNAGYPLLTTAAAGLMWFAAKRSERVRLDQLRGAQPAVTGPVRGHRRHGRGPVDGAADNDIGGRPVRESFLPPVSAGLGPDLGPAEGMGAAAALGLPEGTGPAAGMGTAAGFGPPAGMVAGLSAGPAAAGREFALPPVSGSAAHVLSAQDPAGPGRGAQGLGVQQVPSPGAVVTADLFGLIAIYTLLEDRGEDFDRLAERTVEEVRRREPDTLLFIVHVVPKAPMQRIFYEVYRDRMAYREHRRQPHVVEFFGMHRPYVLATNVIELDLRYAKVSALPSLAAVFGRDGGR